MSADKSPSVRPGHAVVLGDLEQLRDRIAVLEKELAATRSELQRTGAERDTFEERLRKAARERDEARVEADTVTSNIERYVRERDESLAACAAMRAALGQAASFVPDPGDCEVHHGGDPCECTCEVEAVNAAARAAIRAALATDAGRELLERVGRLTAQVRELGGTPCD